MCRNRLIGFKQKFGEFQEPGCLTDQVLLAGAVHGEGRECMERPSWEQGQDAFILAPHSELPNLPVTESSVVAGPQLRCLQAVEKACHRRMRRLPPSRWKRAMDGFFHGQFDSLGFH